MKRGYLTNFEMNSKANEHYDVIIIGTGIAGLYTALLVDKTKKILMITKDIIEENNSNLAQGGIAATLNSKDYPIHVDDTLYAGDNYNDPVAVEFLVKEAKENVLNLVEFGVEFDKNPDGTFRVTKEGGHSSRRILHHKDATGKEIITKLIKEVKTRKNIEIITNSFAIDIITDNNEAKGVLMSKNNDKKIIMANNIVIAAGGIGHVYKNTTNAMTISGDGIAMAYRAGAELEDMEFIQFHPTALNIDGERNFLISEALRGEGAVIVNSSGVPFMEKYHHLKDLAPRDIVARSIFKEMQKGEDIYLDMTSRSKEYLMDRFPTIYNFCLKKGIDISREYIPIVPVQHYIMGGIKIDYHGKTSVDNLYACGEVACSKVHGANRLASNSLLEGVVFGNRVAQVINSNQITPERDYKLSYNQLKQASIEAIDLEKYQQDIQKIMSKYLFITRTQDGMLTAKKKVDEKLSMISSIDLKTNEEYKTANMLQCSKIIIEASLKRTESLGSHYIINEERSDDK